jgi:hypothetical protein
MFYGPFRVIWIPWVFHTVSYIMCSMMSKIQLERTLNKHILMVTWFYRLLVE